MGRRPAHDEVLSYLMYPEVFLKLARAQHSYGDVEVLPTPQFFYGMQTGEEITVELEPGKTLIIKFLTVSEVHPDGTRTVFFELNGQPREVTVRDKSQARTRASERAGRSGPAGASGRADARNRDNRRRRRRPERSAGRPLAGARSHEDAEHRVLADRRPSTQAVCAPGPDGRSEGTAAGDRAVSAARLTTPCPRSRA